MGGVTCGMLGFWNGSPKPNCVIFGGCCVEGLVCGVPTGANDGAE